MGGLRPFFSSRTFWIPTGRGPRFHSHLACPTSRRAECRTFTSCRAILAFSWAALHGIFSRPLKTTSNCVLVSKASSTYSTGKELLLQLGVGRVRMSTPPVLSSPAALPGAQGASQGGESVLADSGRAGEIIVGLGG